MKDINVLLDCTNIKIGGGLQVALSLIESLLMDSRGINFYFSVSSPVFKQLSLPANYKKRFFVVDANLKQPIRLMLLNLTLREIERKNNIDVVFTVFGPNYWRPKKAKHLIGFANAWLVDSSNRAYEKYSFKDRLINKIKNKVLAFLLYNSKAHYVTETNAVKKKFCEYYNSSDRQIDVVGNCLSPYFNSSSAAGRVPELEALKVVKFLTVSHNYPHKNLSIISDLGRLLEGLGYEFIFVITFPEKDYCKMDSDFQKYTFNLGPILVADCPAVYNSCDALFLPSLIECFTVSYLEAMAQNKMILTSDLPFAHDVCGDDALFFDPYDIGSVLKALKTFLDDRALSQIIDDKLSLSYKNKLLSFGNNETRTDAYVEIIKKIYMRN